MAETGSGSSPGSGTDRSAGDTIGELWTLVRTYAQEQTIDPLKNLGRYVGFGSAGALAVGIGVVLVTVGILRLLQTETDTALHGNWSWVPYLATLVIVAVLILIAVNQIKGRGSS